MSAAKRTPEAHRDATILVRIRDDEREMIVTAARSTGATVSSWVRVALLREARKILRARAAATPPAIE